MLVLVCVQLCAALRIRECKAHWIWNCRQRFIFLVNVGWGEVRKIREQNAQREKGEASLFILNLWCIVYVNYVIGWRWNVGINVSICTKYSQWIHPYLTIMTTAKNEDMGVCEIWRLPVTGYPPFEWFVHFDVSLPSRCDWYALIATTVLYINACPTLGPG